MQNLKKPLTILVAIVFLIAVVASLTMLFSVKKVSVEFSVYGESDAAVIQKDLDGFKGKNLVFLKLEDVKKVFDDYPYYEVSEIRKEYPNVINLRVEKRVEVFKIDNTDKSYVLDKNGIVLNDSGKTELERNVLSVELNNIQILCATLGEKIKTSDDELFYSVVKTSQALELNDCVKSVEILKSEQGDFRDAIFKTYTGVVINVWNVDDDGETKITRAFDCYNSLSDYKKTSYYINAYKEKSGIIVAAWTSHNGE